MREPAQSRMPRRLLLTMAIALMLTGPMVAALVLAYAHIHERPCHDAGLADDSMGTHIECPHPRHTLIRHDNRWRCVCPNTMK